MLLTGGVFSLETCAQLFHHDTAWPTLTHFFPRVFRVQVDYSATPEELQAHFQACGTINRITILCDKFTGHPKGSVRRSCCLQRSVVSDVDFSRFAYVEFAESEFVDAAMALDNSLFRGRLIKVRVCSSDRIVYPEPCVIRLRRNGQTSPGSIEVVVVVATGVDTEVVIVVEGEVISHTVLVEGAFWSNFSVRFTGLITRL
jgi:hypothetical protein